MIGKIKHLKRTPLVIAAGLLTLIAGGALFAVLNRPVPSVAASLGPDAPPQVAVAPVAADAERVAILIAAVNAPDIQQAGAGFVVRSGSGCLLLTAAHVIESAVSFEVAPSNRPPLVVTERFRDPARRLDIAAAPLGMDAASCPPPPSETAIQRAVQGSDAELLVAVRGGQSVPLPVTAMKVSEHEIEIRPKSTMFQIQQGMSGAVLVMQGVPVAILSDTQTKTNGNATAIRLDYAAKALGPRVISLTVITLAASAADREVVLRAALKSGDARSLARFAPDATVATIVNTLIDEPETLAGFSSNLKDRNAQAWLKQLIASGFDPNRLASIDNRRRPLLYLALRKSNIPLAITLLDNGAYPYIYEELWGQEYRRPSFLFPLDLIDDLSGSQAEKKALVESMVRAGLTVTEVEVPKSFYMNEQMNDVHDTQRRIKASYAVRLPVQNEIGKPANAAICKHAAADGYDWCKLVQRLPTGIQAKSNGWHKEFQYAALIKPLTIVDGHLYVMTYSPETGSAQAAYGLIRISKDADQLIWYRFMGSAAGMGHCEEIRQVPNWRPDGGLGECWRRQVMIRGEKPGTYFVRGHKDVTYAAVP